MRADATKASVINSPLIDILAQLFFRGTKPFAGIKTGYFIETLLNKFCLTGLNCKIALGKGNLFLLRVSVLGNQVAGISGKHKVLHFSQRTTTKLDHFRDLTKMVVNIDSVVDIMVI